LDVTKVEKNVRKPKTLRLKLIIGGLMFFYFLFFAVPLLSLISQSFLSNSHGFTLQFYRTLFNGENNSMFYASPAKAIMISLGYAGMTALIALGLGLCLAWANLRFGRKRFWEWVEPVFLLPLGTSAVTLGFGFLIALDQPPLDLRSSPFLIPIAHSLVALPFVLRILTPALARIKPALRQSAAILGANSRKVFIRIDLPMISQSLLAAGIFAFLISLGEFGASAMIARPEFPTIPVMIYRYLGRPGELNFGQSLALSTLLLLTTIVGMSLIEKIQKRLLGDF
jgi:thiamine transport system permease protein